MRRFVKSYIKAMPPSALSLSAAVPKNWMFASPMMNRSAYSTRGKRVEFGGEAREMMLAGIERIAKAVGVTLGPKGRNVIIRQPDGQPKITKDGVTVARAIDFANQFEDIGAQLIRQVASKTNDVAGDGTTTATVLAWTIFAEGYKSVATGGNPMDLKRGIDIAVSIILKSVEKQKRTVSDLSMLENVATISANGERPLGELVAKAVHSVGVEGFIAVAESTASETVWEQHGGWSTEAGFLRSTLVTDNESLTCRLTNSLVVVSSDALTVSSFELVVSLLEHAKGKNQPLTIISPSFDSEILDLLSLNHTKNIVKCCAVQLEKNPEVYEDIAQSCGTIAVKLTTLQSVSSFTSVVGVAKEVTQNFDSSVVVGDADVSNRVKFLHSIMQRTLTEEAREQLRERIAKLTKCFAIIRVGGFSQIAITEKKDRVIDALNAARAALGEGIVAGGGAALLHATKELDKLLRDDEEMEQDKRTGIMIVRNAARLPVRLIADNAGEEGAVVVECLMESEDTAIGFDAQNGTYQDMFQAGIVDPIRVVRSCVTDAGSVAGLMITTEASVCDHQ